MSNFDIVGIGRWLRKQINARNIIKGMIFVIVTIVLSVIASIIYEACCAPMPPINTPSPTSTPTFTFMPAPIPPPIATPTPINASSPTNTPTVTLSPTSTSSPTRAHTVTPTFTPTPTFTSTKTLTWTPSPTPTTPPPPPPPIVTITSPQSGDQVDALLDLYFNITGQVPRGSKPVVVVEDPDNGKWAWLQVDGMGSGNWILRDVILGNENNCSRRFRLNVVITGDSVSPGRINAIPSGIRTSVTVTRRLCQRPSVTITSPQNGATVTSPVDLYFTVSGTIPAGEKPVVVVQDPLGQYWAWLHVQDTGGGNWLIPGVTLGNASSCNQLYTLHVVITGDAVPASQISSLPSGVSANVVVSNTCPAVPTQLPTVNITSPQNGATVPSPIDLYFTVSGTIPAGYKPVVVVEDPLGQYWAWLHVQDLGGGNWLLPGVTLGNANNGGQSFTVYVVITNENVPATQILTIPGNIAMQGVTVQRAP